MVKPEVDVVTNHASTSHLFGMKNSKAACGSIEAVKSVLEAGKVRYP